MTQTSAYDHPVTSPLADPVSSSAFTPSANPQKIAVISGGILHEREVSLRSAGRLAKQLRALGHQVQILELNSQLVGELRQIGPNLVWPMIHGVEGESGALQDLLELLNLPYVGTGPAGCHISLSKSVAKSVVAKNGLPTPTAVSLPQMMFRQVGVDMLLHEIEEKLAYPVMVKPAQGGSAMGISYVEDAGQLRTGMVNAFSYDNQVLVEDFVEGTEVSVSIVATPEGGFRCLPPVEVQIEQGRYDFDARYQSGRAKFFTPARLSEENLATVCQLALDCHRVLELDDWSRIDLIVDDRGQPWFIDANVIPGMTDMSLWPLAAYADEGLPVLLEQIVQIAVSRGTRS